MTGKEDEVLRFWIDETGPAGWYNGGEHIDAAIRNRFLDLWEAAMTGACGHWLVSARGALAYVILTDQFPRNMFRGTARAFASDPHARAAAKLAIDRGWDLEIPEPARQFCYLPLEHSENLVDQDRSVALFETRMPQDGADNLLHALAHREVIRRFGRFPTRNAALGRESTESELAYLAEGGYGALVQKLKGQ
jgi:uncharacterized protein (DUF924 family)